MISINGVNISGSNITITKNRVIVDGIDVTPDSKNINITVNGDIENIEADTVNNIVVNGNAGSIKTSSGDVECGDVSGYIKTSSGDVECGNVSGSIETSSGDVKCDAVGGNIKTISGDIKHKKN